LAFRNTEADKNVRAPKNVRCARIVISVDVRIDLGIMFRDGGTSRSRQWQRAERPLVSGL
jgi:hypothetical protein